MWLPLYFVISFVSAVWHVIFCMIHLIWPIGTFLLTLVHCHFTCHAHGEKSSSRQLHFIPFLLSPLSCVCQFVYFVKQRTHCSFLSLCPCPFFLAISQTLLLLFVHLLTFWNQLFSLMVLSKSAVMIFAWFCVWHRGLQIAGTPSPTPPQPIGICRFYTKILTPLSHVLKFFLF